MKRQSFGLILFYVLFLLFSDHPARAQSNDEQGSKDELCNSSEILIFFYQLYRKSGYGIHSAERAAWIFRQNDRYSWLEWPVHSEKSKQVWNRHIPNGAIAIAHTHPAKAIQQPSSIDVSTAKKIKLPIYTISRGGIWKVTPEGIINRIDGNNWHKKVKEGWFGVVSAVLRGCGVQASVYGISITPHPFNQLRVHGNENTCEFVTGGFRFLPRRVPAITRI